MVTPGPPPHAPPASHPTPPTDPTLWHTGLLLRTMSLTQHPHSETTRTSPPPSSRCSAWSPSPSAVTGPVCTSGAELLLFCLVSHHQKYLCVSVLRTQPCGRVTSVLIFSPSPEFFRLLEGVIKSRNLPGTLQKSLQRRIYSTCGFASFASLVYHQATPGSSTSLTSIYTKLLIP